MVLNLEQAISSVGSFYLNCIVLINIEQMIVSFIKLIIFPSSYVIPLLIAMFLTKHTQILVSQLNNSLIADYNTIYFQHIHFVSIWFVSETLLLGRYTFPKMVILNQHYPGIKLLSGKQELCKKSGFLDQNPYRATCF